MSRKSTQFSTASTTTPMDIDEVTFLQLYSEIPSAGEVFNQSSPTLQRRPHAKQPLVDVIVRPSTSFYAKTVSYSSASCPSRITRARS